MRALPSIPNVRIEAAPFGLMAYAEDLSARGRAAFQSSLRGFVNSSNAWMIYRRFQKSGKSDWAAALMVPYIPSAEDEGRGP